MSSTSPGVPGFETINVLANGSSTIVRARSLDDGRDVIVKLLDQASEPILPRRFDRRRRVLRSLSQPEHGFVPLIDHGFANDGRSYIVVPFLALGSLQDQLDRGPTPWYPASQLMAKVAETVGRAHRQDAPLGDIRPSKILLQGADTPLVGAFGMASRRFDDGRPSYRAPEADNDTPPSAPADVFSLALVLATLIAGRPKERGEPVDDFLTELIGLAPARIHDVLEHGLAESVTNRYGSAAAMHRAMARAIDEIPDQHGDDVEADSAPVDLDELLPTPIPVVDPPDIFELARTTADGLPADLGDIVLADDGSEEDGAIDDEPGPDDHLLLPAGLDDIVLAPPSAPFGNGASVDANADETTPFPLEEGAETTSDHGDISDDVLRGWQDDHDDDDATLTIIDLTGNGSTGSGLAVQPGDRAGMNGHVAAGRTGDDDPVDDHPDDVEESAAIDAADEPATDEPDAGETGETEDAKEIVDLTELFTRTHEFVYDPAIHGPADRPSEDGQRSSDGPTVTRPPGDPAAAPSTTTTLLRQTDPIADPGADAGQEIAEDRLDVEDRTDDALEVDGPEPIPTPAPPEMPARPASGDGDLDQTDIFPQADDASPPWLADEADEPVTETSPAFLDPDRSEAIPFPNMGRVRNRVDDHRWQARARTKAELFWFRGRRTFSTIMALLGLVAIAAIVIIFAARELRSATTSVDTEGVPQPLTTATTGVNYLSTDAPFITDVPPSFQPTTATTARRRAATTAAPSTSSPPVTPTAPPTTPATLPPSTEAPPSSTVDRPPTTERTTSTRRRRRTTTTVATTSPTLQTTLTTEVLPTTEDDDDDSKRRGRDRDQEEDAADPPGLTTPALVSLSETSAAVTYSSDECVATQFRLSGTDGSVQTGASRGYEAAIHCSSAWNLDFSGSSGLTSGVGYTLTLTVKNPDGLTASSRLDFTTPA